MEVGRLDSRKEVLYGRSVHLDTGKEVPSVVVLNCTRIPGRVASAELVKGDCLVLKVEDGFHERGIFDEFSGYQYVFEGEKDVRDILGYFGASTEKPTAAIGKHVSIYRTQEHLGPLGIPYSGN